MFRDEAPAVGAKNELTLLGSRLDKRYRKVRKEMRRNVGKFQFKVNFIISVRFSVCWQWVKWNKGVLWSNCITRFVVVVGKIGTALFCTATPSGLVVVVDVPDEPNEMMSVLTVLLCPHRTPFARDALQQPCCSWYILSRYATRPVLLLPRRHPVLNHNGQHHDIPYHYLAPLAIHKRTKNITLF